MFSSLGATEIVSRFSRDMILQISRRSEPQQLCRSIEPVRAEWVASSSTSSGMQYRLPEEGLEYACMAPKVNDIEVENGQGDCSQ